VEGVDHAAVDGGWGLIVGHPTLALVVILIVVEERRNSA
jgi:hypothetical protein